MTTYEKIMRTIESCTTPDQATVAIEMCNQARDSGLIGDEEYTGLSAFARIQRIALQPPEPPKGDNDERYTQTYAYERHGIEPEICTGIPEEPFA